MNRHLILAVLVAAPSLALAEGKTVVPAFTHVTVALSQAATLTAEPDPASARSDSPKFVTQPVAFRGTIVETDKAGADRPSLSRCTLQGLLRLEPFSGRAHTERVELVCQAATLPVTGLALDQEERSGIRVSCDEQPCRKATLKEGMRFELLTTAPLALD